MGRFSGKSFGKFEIMSNQNTLSSFSTLFRALQSVVYLLNLDQVLTKKNAIPKILATKVMVSCLKPTFTLEIWNLDYLIGKETKIVWIICSIRKKTVLTLYFNWGHMDTLPEYSMGRTRVLCVENVERQGIKPRLARHRKCTLCKERGMWKENKAYVPGARRCQLFREELQKKKPNSIIYILQANTHRSAAAQKLIVQKVSDRRAELLLGSQDLDKSSQ